MSFAACLKMSYRHECYDTVICKSWIDAGGFLSKLFGGGGKGRISTPLTEPLEGVNLPLAEPPLAQPPKTEVTTLGNGLKVASENTPVRGCSLMTVVSHQQDMVSIAICCRIEQFLITCRTYPADCSGACSCLAGGGSQPIGLRRHAALRHSSSKHLDMCLRRGPQRHWDFMSVPAASTRRIATQVTAHTRIRMLACADYLMAQAVACKAMLMKPNLALHRNMPPAGEHGLQGHTAPHPLPASSRGGRACTMGGFP